MNLAPVWAVPDDLFRLFWAYRIPPALQRGKSQAFDDGR